MSTSRCAGSRRMSSISSQEKERASYRAWPYFWAVTLSAEPSTPRSQFLYSIDSTVRSLARTAGGRTSWQEVLSWRVHRSAGMASDGGPTASCTTDSDETSAWSARCALYTGHEAIAVTTTATRTAHPAVVSAALIWACRD